jgi:raffinose/stachyose/melibiose transport system substrate-binding protein
MTKRKSHHKSLLRRTHCHNRIDKPNVACYVVKALTQALSRGCTDLVRLHTHSTKEFNMTAYKQTHTIWVLLLLLAVLLAISACAAPGAPAASSAEEGSKAKIVIWMGGEPGTVNAFSRLAESYQQEHPDVEIEATFIGSDLFNPTLLPALNAGTGPDIFATGTGPGQPAAIIEAGHAFNLTRYYCEKGWKDVIPDWVVTQTSSDGKLWAVGDSVENTAVFYNKQIFADNNLSIPATWEEFIAVAEQLKAAGYEIPIGLGAADQWPISHWQTMLWGRYATPAGVNDVMFGDGKWTEDHFVQATTVLKELNDAGYFGPNPLAVNYDDVMAQFWRGEVPMTFTGTWIIGDAVAALGDGIANFSVFQLPPLTPEQKIYPTESIGTGWYINAASPNPDIAADVLDYLFFRPESRIALLESGDTVPVGPLDLESVNLPVLTKEVFASVAAVRENGSIPAFFDTIQPGNMTSVTYDGLQALLAGQMTPEQFTEAIQTAWEEAKAAGTIMKASGEVSCE